MVELLPFLEKGRGQRIGEAGQGAGGFCERESCYKRSTLCCGQEWLKSAASRDGISGRWQQLEGLDASAYTF